MLKDAVIPGHRNVIKKEAEKTLKYNDLITEIQRMWNVKERVMPVIIGATGASFKITQTIPEQNTGKAPN